MRRVLNLRVALSATCALALTGSFGCAALRNRLDPCGRTLPAPPGGEVLPMNFAPEGGGFRVGLPPTKPVGGEEADGPSRKTYRWFVFGHGQYEIVYADSSGSLADSAVSAAALDRMKASALSQGNRRLVSERELRLGPHPGRELVLRDGDGLLIRRFYLTDSRIYLVSAAVSSKLEGCALGDMVKNLDTFELVGESAPPAAAPPTGAH